jgi:K+-sensing histidine kinase KdpD
MERRYRDLVRDFDCDAHVQLCVCLRVEDIVRQLLPTGATIVLGGRAGGWLPAEETKLVRRLTALGHHVVVGNGSLSTSHERRLRALADEVSEKAAPSRLRDGLEPVLLPERVMACMSSAIHAPRVIRTGARIAGRLGAQWYAVYVETPRERPGRIRREDSDALRQNMTLAEHLGATVVRVRADRPADGLIAFGQREAITHVIFGRSARSRWERLWRASTIDTFLGAVRDAAVHVVPPEGRG